MFAPQTVLVSYYGYGGCRKLIWMVRFFLETHSVLFGNTENKINSNIQNSLKVEQKSKWIRNLFIARNKNRRRNGRQSS